MPSSDQPVISRIDFLLVVACTYGTHVVLSVIALGLRGFDPQIEIGDRNVWILLIEEALLSVLVGFLLFRRGWRLKHLGLQWSSHLVLEGAGLFLVTLAIYWLVYSLCALIPGVGESVRQVSIRSTTSLPAALLVSVLNPLFEELLNLGFVQRLLSKHGLAFALGSAVLLRLITHLYQGPLAAVAILPLGIVFGIYFHFRKELLPVVIAHGLLDFVAFSQA